MRERRASMLALALCIFTLRAGLPPSPAKAQTVAQALDGFPSGENWFGEGFAYDITDTRACWELLQRPVTVLNVGERETVYPWTEPGGKRVVNDEFGGCIAGSTAAVHVLGKNQDGWTLIEGMDDYDRLIRGYVKTKLLKTVTPNKKYGVIIDKLTQRLYVFIDGELFSSCAVSTGLAEDGKAFNETAAGEYLLSSWVGPFENEGMVCEMAIRFNNGDLMHQVPYMLLGDGTKRFSNHESLLGQKASHGCVRVARWPNDDGLCIKWLWNNLKRNTKVVIWDDDGRTLPYPAGDTALYYNPSGGSRYHLSANCAGVKPEYRPLSEFFYAELEQEPYRKLEPCDFCTPVKRKAWIDAFNHSRGLGDPQGAFAAGEEPTADWDPSWDDQGGAEVQSVEVVIIPSE